MKISDLSGCMPYLSLPMRKEYGTFEGTIPTLPEGINKKQSHQSQKMARNVDVVEEVKEEARKNDDIPAPVGNVPIIAFYSYSPSFGICLIRLTNPCINILFIFTPCKNYKPHPITSKPPNFL